MLKHGTLTVGFIGLAEMSQGPDWAAITAKAGEAQNLGLEIVGYMRKRMDEASRKTRPQLFPDRHPGRRACPAGSSGWTRSKYGIIPGVTDREYYTNSFHVPVYYRHQRLRQDPPWRPPITR